MTPPYFRFPCLLAVMAAGWSWSFSARAAVADSRVTDLLHELKSLSAKDTSYSRVKSLVVALTQEDPSRAFRFVKLAERKLSANDSLESKFPQLTRVANKLVERSVLPPEVKNQIRSQIGNIYGRSLTVSLSNRGPIGDLTVTPGDSSVTMGDSSVTMGGTTSDSRNFIGTSGVLASGFSGTITLATTGEGLTGETPINVGVGYIGTVFSGNALFIGSTNGSWATATNWGDLNVTNLGGPGAPGLDGAEISSSDTATFGDTSGTGSASIVTLDGVSPILAGVTFNATTTHYTIAPGTGGGIQLTGQATPIAVSSGGATIGVPLTGRGVGLNKTGSGTLLLTGANTFTGATLLTGGTLRLATPNGGSALAATGGVTIGPGATLLLGALSLTSSSVIDLGDGATVLRFAGSSGDWTGDLSIWDYDGTPLTGGGTDEVFFGTNADGLTASQVAEIIFYSGAGTGTEYSAELLSDGEIAAVPESGAATETAYHARLVGNGEIVAVPECNAVVPGVLAVLGAAVFGRRRRGKI